MPAHLPRSPLLRSTFLAGLLALPCLVWAANAEPLDLDPDLSAKLGREKLKQNRIANTKEGRAGQGRGGGCGQIDIGNGDQGRQGARGTASRERTVIVTGPVINATNCR